MATARVLGFNHSVVIRRNDKEASVSATGTKRILYFTDTHVQAKLEIDHLVWIGKHIKATNPDYIVHGGDFADYEGLCSHVRNETLEARQKPALAADMAAMGEAMAILNEAAGRSDFHVTLGNHESRLWAFEDKNPELAGLLIEKFDSLYKTNNWEYSKFGTYHTLHGVDFTHSPMMMAGKPVGGKLSVNTVATNSIADCVYGHTHMKAEFTARKFGPGRETTVINGGCSMPIGYIPKYIQSGATGGWWHGIVEIEVEHGKIQDTNYVKLETLKKRYG